MNHNPQLLKELQDYLRIALRVKNEGLEVGMEYVHWESDAKEVLGYPADCGTVCCMEGWRRVLEPDTRPVNGEWGAEKKVNKILYGGHRQAALKLSRDKRFANYYFGSGERLTSEQALSRQIYAARWFIRREEALRDYELLRAMPRKERRALKLAA